MKLGIFLPNWLGDLVMATPTLRAIRRHFGRDTEIVGILLQTSQAADALTGWTISGCSILALRNPGATHGPGPSHATAPVRRALLLTNSLNTALGLAGRASRRGIKNTGGLPADGQALSLEPGWTPTLRGKLSCPGWPRPSERTR